MAETPDRYCGNCGHELSPTEQFCRNCGRPVHETARVSTPEADVQVPPPHQQAGETSAPPLQQGEAHARGRSRVASGLFVGCIVVVLALFVLFAITTIVGGGGSNEPGNSGRLGITPDAVRQRVRRGTIQHDKEPDGRVYVYLDELHTPPQATPDALVDALRDQVETLKTELNDWKAEAQRKDTIIMSLTQRIPEIEPPAQEPPESPHRGHRAAW